MSNDLTSGRLYLGIDGGGTRTRAALIDGSGALLAHARAGPGNYVKAGPEVVRRSLEDLRQRLFGRGGPDLRLEAVCAGLAGSGRKEDRRVLRRLIGDVFPSRRLILESDGFVALYGAGGGAAGILAIAGTGSIVVGLGQGGRRARAGGWGHLFGDEGSGYAIAREGIRRVLRAHDGLEMETQMSEELLARLGAVSVPELLTLLHAEHAAPERMAALAPVVFEAASNGDPAAHAVLRGAACDLADGVAACAARLKLDSAAVAIYPAGGAFRARLYRRMFCHEVGKRLPKARFSRPRLTAERGAALYALHRADG